MSRTTSMRANFFQLVRIGSKKSPLISRVNKHQYNNNKIVRRENSFLKIARGEGIRSAQLGKSLLLRNRACWIHPLEFRCTEPGEWLQEEWQPGAPCCVSSDDIWSVAVNVYETTRSYTKTPQLHKVYFCYYCAIVSARVLSNGGVLAGNKLMSGSTGSARCYVLPPLKQ